MSKWMMAGLLGGVIAGAVLATPQIVAATPVTATLTTAEQAQAAKLAESIVKAITSAQAETRALPEDQAKLRIQLAVQAVIRNSGATPTVADAALEMATARLKSEGFLDCVNPNDKDQTCTPAGAALASLSSLLKSIVQTTPASTSGRSGPIAITSPTGLTPPNSGNSVKLTAVTPPTEDPPADPPVTPPTTPPTGGSTPLGDPTSVPPSGGPTSDYRGS